MCYRPHTVLISVNLVRAEDNGVQWGRMRVVGGGTAILLLMCFVKSAVYTGTAGKRANGASGRNKGREGETMGGGRREGRGGGCGRGEARKDLSTTS